jgi:type II secretory pathway pseudopilin PulG
MKVYSSCKNYSKVFFQNKKAFTLVELIITIIILIIIWTISVIQYTSYLSWTRDTNRITQLNDITKLMSLYRLNNKLPIPEDWVSIIWSWWIILWVQWYAWKIVLSKIKFNNWWFDPLDKTPFTYYTSQNWKFFQLMWFLEEKMENNLNFIWKTYAINEYKKRYPIVSWDKIWIFIDSNNNPIQNIPTIKDAGTINISTTTWSFTSFLTNTQYISWDNTVVSKVTKLSQTWWNWCNSSWTTDIICKNKNE